MEKYLIFVDGFSAYNLLGGTNYVVVECRVGSLNEVLKVVFGSFVSMYVIVKGYIDEVLSEHVSRGIMISNLTEVLRKL